MRFCVPFALALLLPFAAETGAISEAEKKEYVDYIDGKRANIKNPTAAAMTKAVWSDTIANLALTWVKECKMTLPGKSDTAYKGLGGLFGTTSAHTTFGGFADFFWWGSKDFYKFSTDDCKKDIDCPEWSQILYEKVTQFGCARHKCTDIASATHYVCFFNKKPVEQPPYRSGPPCSQCACGECSNNQCVLPPVCPTSSTAKPTYATRVVKVVKPPNIGNSNNYISKPLLVVLILMFFVTQ